MRNNVSSKRIATKSVSATPAASGLATPTRQRLILAMLLATTALTAAPVAVFAADKVVDGVTETINTPQSFDNVVVGDTSPNSQLDIISGATVDAATRTIIGNQSTSVGTVTVSGNGSTVTAAGDIGVGYSGTGTLSVSNGGAAQADRVGVGYLAGGTGTVTVSGASSAVRTVNDVGVGVYGKGTLTVSGGATVEVGRYLAIGYKSGSSGTVTVSGSGSQLTTTGYLSVGNQGSGTLAISDGGFVSTNDIVAIGVNSGSSGKVTVSGSGSQLTAANDIIVGNQGSGSLAVSNGGVVSSSNLLIGYASGTTGTVTVSGTGSKLTTTNDVNIGFYGTGSLSVSDGGAVSVGRLIISRRTDAQGTVTVSGQGSTLTVSGGANSNIYIANGYRSSATMTISNGGTVEAGGVSIASSAGSQGNLTVTGAGSKLTLSGNSFIGDGGSDSTGTVTIAAGGEIVSNSSISIGAIGVGLVTVSGSGSKLTTTGGITVGGSSTGTLTVSDGGLVSTTGLTLGNDSGSAGTVTVSGSGSKLTANGNAYVGSNGAGTLTISDGGAMESTGRIFVAASAAASGAVTVSGSGSKLTTSSDLSVGIFGAGTLVVSNGGVVTADRFFVGSEIGSQGTAIVSGSGSKLTANSGVVGDEGKGTLTVSNGGVVQVSGQFTFGTNGNASATLNIGAAAGEAAMASGRVQGANGAAANIVFGAGTGAIVFNHTDADYIFDATISGSGTLSQLAGVTSLTGNLAGFTGATNVSGGTLSVDTVLGGSVNVLAGGTVVGTGTVGALNVSAGGTLAPGNVATPQGTLTVSAPLTFAAGSSYSVRISAIGNSFTQVNSTAILGGATVNAVFGATGDVSLQSYKILTATGGLTGTFGTLVANHPLNFTPTLSYDANDVYLRLAFAFPAGLNNNQQAVANALTQAFNATGTVPLVFGTLDAQGLSQAAGETATGSQQTGFDAMNRFMTLLADPDAGNRGAEIGPNSGSVPLAYAGAATPLDAMAAITGATKAPYLKAASSFVPSWKVWGAGFGGSEATNGNAAVGSNRMTSSVYGVAAGADYRLAPDWTLGFALAGGGTNFKVAGSGDGQSDLFQAGGFVRHTMGPAYVSAALAYGFQNFTTTRNVGASRFQAKFDTNTVSERIEGGWRFFAPVLGGVGVTPYAAAQLTTMRLPDFAETVLSGVGSFALAYGSKTVTDPLSELGVRTDRSYVLLDGAVLTLRGRTAWVHDFNPNRSVSATFQALPLASFVVNGAAQAGNAALISAGTEVAWASGWSAGLTFNGTFSDVTQSYAGKAVVRRTW